MGDWRLLSIIIFGIVFNSLVQIMNGEKISRPNVVFILVDDAGWNDFSFHGSAQIPTPNIDALAFSGTILNSYYSSPLCTPSPTLRDTVDGLPLQEKLLPEYLKELGYSTHLVGKWHLGHSTKLYTPTFRGFDTHYGYWLGSQDYYDHTSPDSGYWGYDFRIGMEVNRLAFGRYNTDLITEESLRIIREHDVETPMFLMVAQEAPHPGNQYDPLQAPKENVDKFKDSIHDENRRAYAGMVDKLDESVGEIISSLANKGILNNTIIVFASDNGGAPEGYGLSYASNWPLRGVKNTLWEGGTRVAACVWSPLIKNRVSSADIMHASDWLPTLYEAVGGNTTNLGVIDGVSMWETLTKEGASSPRTTFLYNIDDIYNNSAVRFNEWKLIQGNTSNNDLGDGVWDGWYGFYNDSANVVDVIPKILESNVAKAMESIGFTLNPEKIEQFQRFATVACDAHSPPDKPCDAYSSPCLFNIVEDPCERRNSVDEYPQILELMQNMLKTFNETAREPIDLSHHPEAAPKNWGYVWTNWKDYE